MVRNREFDNGAFVNPLTDAGFKIIFGREASKPVLITLINELLKDEHEVEDLTFIDKEDHSDSIDEQLFIYDLLCLTSTGEYIIVEMQSYWQRYFLDRALGYTCRVFSSQGGRIKSKLDYDTNVEANKLKRTMREKYHYQSVYGIFLMNFKDACLDKKTRTDVVLADRDTGKIINKHLRQIYIQFPYFTKSLDECETLYDKLLYAIKNMNTWSRLPDSLHEQVFQRLERLALKANMSTLDRMTYENAYDKYWDLIDTLEFREEKGRKEGRAEGILMTARNLKSMGMASIDIAKATGIPTEEIERL